MDSESISEWNDLSPAEKAKSLVDAADSARREENLQLAYGYYIQALSLYRGLDDRRSITDILIHLNYLAGWTDFYDGLDMFTRKQLLAKEAIPLAREIGDTLLLARALCAFNVSIADVDPVDSLEEALALARQSGDKATIAMALESIAKQAGLMRDLRRKDALQREALALHEELGDNAGVARVLFGMSLMAEPAERLRCLEQALIIQRELGAKRQIYVILTMLARYGDRHDLDRQEAMYAEALELAREIGSPKWHASCLNHLADIAASRGDNVRADALRAESSAIYQEPEIDPALQEAFNVALDSRDMKKMGEAFKKMTT